MVQAIWHIPPPSMMATLPAVSAWARPYRRHRPANVLPCAMPARSLVPEPRLRHLTATLNRRHPEYGSRHPMAGSLAGLARRLDAPVR